MRKKSHKKQRGSTLELLNRPSPLGPAWLEIFSVPVESSSLHFEKALYNLILQPEVNSTVLLRADIMKNIGYSYKRDASGDTHVTAVNEATVDHSANFRLDLKGEEGNNNGPASKKQRNSPVEGEQSILTEDAENSMEAIRERNLDDLEIRSVPTGLNFVPKRQIVRRLVPRNPFKDYITNQTCLMLTLNNKGDNSASGDSPQADESLLVVYIPHINAPEECPYYLPPVSAIGIYYDKEAKKLSMHYLPFNYHDPQALADFQKLDSSDRSIRIAYRLLQTAQKHSKGVMNGYEKRVQHDLVVSKVLFQNRYIALKKKYSQFLIDNWQENTDPKKHVFEDIAIAAFLIELWQKIYGKNEEAEDAVKKKFQFADLGCGNGILVYILLEEGYNGTGIDARTRKSWNIYPAQVRENLKEQVIIPEVLLRPHPAIKNMAPQVTDNGRVFQIPLQNLTFKKDLHGNHNHKNKNNAKKAAARTTGADKGTSADAATGDSVADEAPALPSPVVQDNVPVFAYYDSATLLTSSYVNTATFPENTFIIGNHSDELTLWIPLFGYDFMVIPCCSHDLSGKKARYLPKRLSPATSTLGKELAASNSAYSGLVQHAEEVANRFGWKTEKEMLRIPSTRNCAIIGYEKYSAEEAKRQGLQLLDIYEILTAEGGAEGWVENTMSLMKEPPRSH